MSNKLIDLGIVKGQRLFYTGNRSLAQLIEAGEVCAIPTLEGVMFKRREICTELERQAAYTLAEVRAIAAEMDDES